uniref:MRH domain-containing protein n=1 Tax=Romanomermis culicivorax TaxID=13658 RepID=A0A915L1Z1_ROMCU
IDTNTCLEDRLIILYAYSSFSADIASCVTSWNRKLDDSKKWPDVEKTLNKLLNNVSKLSTSDNKYELSFCDNPTDGQRSNVKSGIWSKNERLLLGSADQAELQFNTAESWLALHLKKGDQCKLKFSNNGVSIDSNYSSLVLMVCDVGAKLPKLSSIIPKPEDQCSYVFVLSSEFLCSAADNVKFVPSASSSIAATKIPSSSAVPPLVKTSDSDAVAHEAHKTSFLAAFFLILLILAFLYIVVGFLYKRYVDGARGIEQVPHYLMWIRLENAVQNLFPSFGRSSTYDPASRYSNNFRYDQPPLLNEEPSTPMTLDADDDASLGFGREIRTANQTRGSSVRRHYSGSNAAPQNGVTSDNDERLLVV